METIRINKVLRELNISLDRAVDFLASQGHYIDPSPNAKINSSQYELLLNQFLTTHEKKKRLNISNNKDVKYNKESEKFEITTEYTLARLRKNRGIPQTVYKFFSTNPYNIEALKEKYIYLTHFSKFNDPFDCNLQLIDFQKINKKSNQKKREKALIENFENVGVSCFSRKNDSILMWSHYAENHSGFCIEFYSNKTMNSLNPLDVNYIENFKKVNYYANKKDALYHMLYTKSLDWHYEQELRLVKTVIKNEVDRKLHYYDEDIKAIYFGTNSELKLIDEVMEIIATKYSDTIWKIKFFKAKLAENSFKIEWVEIKNK